MKTVFHCPAVKVGSAVDELVDIAARFRGMTKTEARELSVAEENSEKNRQRQRTANKLGQPRSPLHWVTDETTYQDYALCLKLLASQQRPEDQRTEGFSQQPSVRKAFSQQGVLNCLRIIIERPG